MSTLRRFLCHDGVVGSSERWWSGKKGFDFLTKTQSMTGHEKNDATGTAVAKCMEDRVERLLVELSAPADSYEEVASSDTQAVERGLTFMMQLAVDEYNFTNFGSDIFQTFYDTAASAEEPLRRFALLRTEVTAQMWLQNFPSLVQGDNDEISPDYLLDFMMGMYTLERVGIGHDAKEEVRAAAQKYSVEDFFGVSEAAFRGNVDDGRQLPMTLSEYSNALSYTFYAHKVGIDIKVEFSTVLALLPRCRPYMQFPLLKFRQDDPEEFDAYIDQLTLIFTLVHVLSNFGELRLCETLLPLEFAYLSDPVHMTRAVASADVNLIGELCHCLAVLGLRRDCEPLCTGLAYLRESQLLSDGSWPARDERLDSYSRFHATMCAVSALNLQRFRGFGPSDPQVLDMLSASKLSTRLNEGDAENIQPRELSIFINTPLHSMSAFSRLDCLYALSTQAVSQEVNMSSQLYGLSRLRNILKTQKVQNSKYQGPLILSQRLQKTQKRKFPADAITDRNYKKSQNETPEDSDTIT